MGIGSAERRIESLMSYILKSVGIKGFLENRDISLELNPDVNFLIGRNGTGKTTFVKLLYACLSVDLARIREILFSEIIISFFDTKSGNSPQLKITRNSPRSRSINIYFRDKGNAKFEQIIDEESEMLFYTDRFHSRDKKIDSIRERRRKSARLTQEIMKNINFSWLPLHRSRDSGATFFLDEDTGEEHYSDPIDTKIDQLVDQMTRYFSVLDSRTSLETKAFQKAYFLSLVSFKAPSILSVMTKIREIDFNKQKNLMKDILIELGLSDDEVQFEVDSFYQLAQNASRNLSQEGSIQIEDVFSVADALRLSEIVSEFQSYEAKKRDILKPKTDFEALFSNLLLNKRMIFSESNQPVVYRGTEIGPAKEIQLTELSSGEKQLFIIFAETLLQSKNEYIFLADEPELSLHIDWQEQLVRNIRTINPNCQLVFATHSPDVVSVYQDNVFDFEKL